MRRTYFEEPNGLAADAKIQTALEGPRRHRDVDAFEVERREDLGEKFSRLSDRARVALHVGESAGAAVTGHLLGARLRSDNLGAVYQLVAETVIAVGVRVD